MTKNVYNDRLIKRIQNLEKAIREVRTKQTISSDVSIPLQAGLSRQLTLEALGASYSDISDVDVTIVEPSNIFVVAIWTFIGAALGGGSAGEGRITWDGVEQGETAISDNSETPNARYPTMQCYVITENTAGTYNLKQQARETAGTIALDEWSAFTYIVMKQPVT